MTLKKICNYKVPTFYEEILIFVFFDHFHLLHFLNVGFMEVCVEGGNPNSLINDITFNDTHQITDAIMFNRQNKPMTVLQP